MIDLDVDCFGFFLASSRSLLIFRKGLSAFQFSRQFFTESLSVWQLRDASRLAGELLTPYGQAYASLLAARHAEDERYITAAERQLAQIRGAMVKLVGPSRADHMCKRVEEAVSEGNKYIDLGEEKGGEEAGSKSPPRTRYEAEAEKKSTRSPRGTPSGLGARSPRSTSPQARSPRAEVKTPEELTFSEEKLQIPAKLTKLLRNEMLAHEIILNPDFKIEDRSKGEGAGMPDTPEAHAMMQIKETMQRIFWDRLVFSLTPADQESPMDFQVGCVAHVRYNGPQGSFFRAVVKKVNEDGTLDVVYPEDGIKEQNVPISRCRLKTDPLDYRPLLALLEEVRDKLIELTPNRQDLAAELREKVDIDLLRQMLEQHVFDPSSVWGLIGFLVQRVISLEAPARAIQTESWFQSIKAQAGAATGSVDQLIPKLPEVFQYLFDKVDEIKRDIANAHVDMIRPFLAHHGIAYERLKFAERLQSGELTLVNTQNWLASVLSSTANPVPRETLDALIRGDAAVHRQVLVRAFLHLIRLPVRLDTPAANLPEVLTWDGRRMACLRDELDRLSLVAVYSTLLRQFMAQSRVLTPAVAIEQLETRLYTVLQQDDGVKLDHLVDECQETAKRLFAAQGGRVMTPDQVTMLRNLLSNAASATNPVFALMFGRLLEVLGLYMQGQSRQAEETVARYHFRPFANQLKTAGTQLNRVFSHNMAVHGQVLSFLLKEEATTAIEGSSEGKA